MEEDKELAKEKEKERKEKEKERKAKEREKLRLEKEKEKRAVKATQYSNAWVTIFSILMFFFSFFGSYFVVGREMGLTFVKAVIVLIVSNIISRILVMLWNFTIPKDQWALIVHGPPQVESRTERLRKERERLLANEEIMAIALSARQVKERPAVVEEVVKDEVVEEEVS